MPSVVKIHLSRSDKSALQRLRRNARSGRLRDRIAALLMLAAGVPIKKILEALLIARTTLVNWKQRWLKRRYFGMEDAPRSGRPPEADAAYIKEMVRVVQRDPREFGYAFTRWTAPRLAQYLGETTDIWLTPQWISELLRMQGIAWRKTKRTIRNLQNRAATQRAQKALRRLKKGLSRQAWITSSGSQTASVSNSCRSRCTRTGVVATR